MIHGSGEGEEAEKQYRIGWKRYSAEEDSVCSQSTNRRARQPKIDYSTVWVVYALLHRIWTTFRLQTIMVIWKNYEVSELKALFHDTLDETSHCGRYPAIVQRRVHFLISLWFRPRKAVMNRLKKGRRAETFIRQNDAEQLISCAYSPRLVVIACILTDYASINAKRSPHALYQNMRT